MNHAKRLLPLICLAASFSAAAPVGVAVNDVDVSALSGNGWTYDPATSNLVLSAAGPYTLSGTNTAGEVSVVCRTVSGAEQSVALSNLVLSSSAASPFALATNAVVALSLAGTNELSSSKSGRPAILVPGGASLAVTNAPSEPTNGGTLSAVATADAPGIGGPAYGAVGDIAIAGGRVVARGNGYAVAGIGAGNGGTGGSVTIAGGLVDARGGTPGAGLGGGGGGNGPSVSISGGTVFAQGHNTADIGPSAGRVTSASTQAVLLTGGSLRIANRCEPPASNGTERVWCVTVTDLPPTALVEGLQGLPDGYGVHDLYADADGRIYLWLPNGDHEFSIGDERWIATVAGADTVAVRVLDPVDPLGVCVDGVDVSARAGPGWTYDPGTRQLALSADCVLSGSNDVGAVSVRVAADCAVTLSNLCLRLAGVAGPYFPVLLGDGVAATLVLSGTNTLWAGSGNAAVGVPTGTALTIAGDGTLDASGGYVGAGIGGWNTTGCGTVSIEGGILLLGRGSEAACIGGGARGDGGDVTISGGTVLLREYTSYPVPYSIGRGRNSSGANGTLTITGGSLGELPRSSASHAISPNLLGSAPTNAAGDLVHSVTVTNLPSNAPVALAGLPAYYGTNSLVADDSGKIYLWLPDGDYAFTAGGADYTATVDGANTVADLVPPVIEPLGVLVNGVDVCALAGDGWTYDPATSNLVLSAAGPYTLSGTNTAGQVQVVGRPASGNLQSIVLSNLVLSAAAPLALETNASPLLTVLGESSLSATAAGRPAILVPAGASLLVAAGDAVRDSLSATGGEGSPAVSGAGTLGLVGGRLSFAGGAGAASLGPGSLVAFGGTTVAPSVSAATSALLAGGSFRAASADVSPAPSNATERVFCVTVTNLVPNAAVEDLSGLPDGYGVGGIVADGDGCAYLWFPDGMHVIAVDGVYYRAEVAGADIVAELVPSFEPVGVTVNGIDIGLFAGNGWTYSPTSHELRLSGAGPYAVSGTNTAGEVTVLCRALAGGAEQSVELSNLVLSSSAASPFALEAGAAVALSLAGTNELTSSKSGQPALLVPGGASLTVTNAPSEPTNGGTLSATATIEATGIGGLAYGAVGDIAIAGGRVVARGNGFGVAGIGAGNSGTGGSVSISGGLVDASGGIPGAGLGGGGSGKGPSVSISGGTVVAEGHNTPDVGRSSGSVTSSSTQTILLTGGSLHAKAPRCEPDPGNGVERVWCVTVTNLPPNALVEGLQGLPAGYGAHDLYADADGKLYLWLPAGDYELRIAPDDLWTATVADKNVVATYRSVAKPDSIVIDSIAVAEDAVTLVVTVAPASWLEAHAGDLRVRASDTLPVSAGELLDPAAVAIAADPATGEATLVLPSPAPPSRFYRVEIP